MRTPDNRPPLPDDGGDLPEPPGDLPPEDPLATLSRHAPAGVLFLMAFLVLLAVYLLTAPFAHEPVRPPDPDTQERLREAYPEEDLSDLYPPGDQDR